MIHIKDWVIDADDRCYTVGRLRTRKVKGKDGTEKTEDFVANPRYYTSLCAACEGIIETEMRTIVHDNEMTLTEAVERMEELHKEIVSLIPW